MVSSCPPTTASIGHVSALDKDLRSKGLVAGNSVARLLELLEPATAPSVRAAAAHAVRRGLPHLTRAVAASSDEHKLERWLAARREEYADRLATCIARARREHEVEAEAEAEDECLRALVACAAVQGDSAWKHVVRAALSQMRFAFVRDAVQRYADLRTCALQVVAESDSSIASWTSGVDAFAKTKTSGKAGRNAISGESFSLASHADLLEQRLEVLHASGEQDPSLLSARSAASTNEENVVSRGSQKLLRRAFGDAWLSVLADKALTPAQRATAVASFPKNVIPRMSNPLRLSDFLVDIYNDSSTVVDIRVSVTALDALFVLISEHRLDYPEFYPRLYQRLTPYALFGAPERERFLSLTAVFLTRGSYLPRTMVAAFVKRLARRALIAPPAGAMWCLRLALDLLHKHPSVSFLVHKSVDLFELPAARKTCSAERNSTASNIGDPFNDSLADPLASGAESSSLWELDALRNHMSPAVSRLVEAFSRDIRKRPPPPPGNLEDYASLGFSDVFGAEFKRRAKSVPLAYHAPDAEESTEVASRLKSAVQWR